MGERLRGSIVLAADDPAALARFYAALLKVEAQPGHNQRHWRLRWPPSGYLEIYAPSSTRPQPRQSGRLALTLQRSAESGQQLAELEHWVTGCLGLGATLLEPPRQESFGVEAWLADPEANRLLLLVL